MRRVAEADHIWLFSHAVNFGIRTDSLGVVKNLNRRQSGSSIYKWGGSWKKTAYLLKNSLPPNLDSDVVLLLRPMEEREVEDRDGGDG